SAPPAAATTSKAVATAGRAPGRQLQPILLLALALAVALFVGVALRLVPRPTPAVPPSGDDATVSQSPVVGERERFLLMAVERSAGAKQPDRIREGAGHYVELGVLYLDDRRFDEAERLFRAMINASTAPPSYRTFGELGTAVVLAM